MLKKGLKAATAIGCDRTPTTKYGLGVDLISTSKEWSGVRVRISARSDEYFSQPSTLLSQVAAAIYHVRPRWNNLQEVNLFKSKA